MSVYTLKKLGDLVSRALSSIGSPGSFYVTSRADVRASTALWKSRLPTVTPYYAVKSNHSPLLLKWLHEEGVAFDCASVREIDSVLAVGAYPYRIVYANPCKRREDIQHAEKSRVSMTVIDSSEEVDKLVDEGWSGDAFLRIRVDDTNSVVPFGKKFGLPVTEVKNLARHAKSNGLPLVGISFHVGSTCNDVSQYTRAILQASDCMKDLRDAGHSAHSIDIGGGFTNRSFCSTAHAITKASALIPPVQMIAEPGRFFSEGSHSLFVKVIGKKGMPDGSPGFRYTLDESLYGQFSCIPFDCAKPRWVRIGEGQRNRCPGVLFGRTCDSVDMIAMSASTEELMEGDWLLFPNMGAYTSVTSSEFNGFPRPPVYELDESMNMLIPEMDTSVITYVTPVVVPSKAIVQANLSIYKSLLVV